MIKKIALVFLCVLAGFAGGFMSNSLFKAESSHANSNSARRVISAEEFQLVDHNGKTTGTWTSCDRGSPCLNLYDSQGDVRLQMALYSDGLPLVGLFDRNFQAKGLFRLAGANGSPVLVMKHENQDRIILGLGLSDSPEPFFVYYDQDGQKQVQFGKY